jgi:hypothetical protein
MPPGYRRSGAAEEMAAAAEAPARAEALGEPAGYDILAGPCPEDPEVPDEPGELMVPAI